MENKKQYFLDQINKLKMSKEFIDAGIEAPNEISKTMTLDLCLTIYNKKQLVPAYIAVCPDEGLFVTYHNGLIELSFDVYNEGYIAGIVNDNKKKKILFSEIVKDNLDTFFEVFKV